MAKQRLYVGNLPYSAREAEVEQLFAAYGEVTSVALPVDRDTGRSRGFGFVEMSVEDAQKAITALDGRDFGGRRLAVSVARERTDRGPRASFGGGQPQRNGYGRGQRPDRGYGSKRSSFSWRS